MPIDAKMHLIRNRYLVLIPESMSLYGFIKLSSLYDVKMHRNDILFYPRVLCLR